MKASFFLNSLCLCFLITFTKEFSAEFNFSSVPTLSPTISSMPTLLNRIIQDDDYEYNPIKKQTRSESFRNKIFSSIPEATVIMSLCLLSLLVSLPCALYVRKWVLNDYSEGIVMHGGEAELGDIFISERSYENSDK